MGTLRCESGRVEPTDYTQPRKAVRMCLHLRQTDSLVRAPWNGSSFATSQDNGTWARLKQGGVPGTCVSLPGRSSSQTPNLLHARSGQRWAGRRGLLTSVDDTHLEKVQKAQLAPPSLSQILKEASHPRSCTPASSTVFR